MRAVRETILLLTAAVIIGGLVLSCHRNTVNSNNVKAPKNELSEANANTFDLAEFRRNKDLWTSKAIKNYKMIVGAEGFLTNFPEEVLIEVRNQKAVSTQSLSKTGKNYVQSYKPFNSIDKIFDFVEKESQKKPNRMTIQYDSELGYPKNLGLDERKGISDDELSLTVSKLEIIK